MLDITNFCLGRKAIVRDSRTLRLAKYLTTALAPPPDKIDWTQGLTSWGMMMNDTLGCCTIAGCGHAIQVWSKNSNEEITISDEDVLATYEAWDGYKPSDPSTDCGGIELDVLNNWRTNGLVGHKILAYTSVNYSNTQEVKQGINLFGGLYTGVGLPVSAQSQDVWDVVSVSDGSDEPGSWGGHCVFVAGYDQDGLTCITWGAPKKITWAFWHKYFDESYALIGVDWFNSGGQAPSGFNASQLEADLAQIR